MSEPCSRKEVFAWALYDWANSAFATTVMAGFFPIFFKKYWHAGSEATVSTMHLGMSNSIASLCVAILAPILGAVADNTRSKKNFLGFFALLGVVTTALLFTVNQGDWLTAACLYALATIGFLGGNVFYDAMITNVATDRNIDGVSAFGYSLGYLGGGILFAVNVLMFQFPHFFGFADGITGVKVSFPLVAIWWGVFAIPLFVLVKDRNPDAVVIGTAIGKGLSQLWQTLKEIRKHKNVALFLLSYWVYIDGVHTVIVMAIDYGMSIGLEAKDLIAALLLTQFVGFPAALGFGKLASRLNAKIGILIALATYCATSIYGYFMDSALEFYILAFIIGLVQGGVQCLSRSLFATLIPKENSTQFFGFYNMMGKFATIIGPAIMGQVAYWTGNPRLSIAFISVMFVGGGLLLCTVKVKTTG